GGFQVDHPSGTIRSSDGRYERTSGSAWATGNATLTDSTGKVTLTARDVHYSRPDRMAEAMGNPVFRKLDPTDTMEVRANHLLWYERERIAHAMGNVVLRKGAVTARASRARLDEINHLLTLQGNPSATMGTRVLTGEEMRLVVDLKQQKIREIKVLAKAVGTFASDPDSQGVVQSGRLSGDTLLARIHGDTLEDVSVWKGAKGLSWKGRDSLKHDELEGDSLRFSFDGKKVRQVRAWRKAIGRFRGETDSSGVSQIGMLSADTLVANMVNGAFRNVSVWPKAKGYSWRSNDSAHKDEVEGDSIGFAFEGKKLTSARVKGTAKSIYHHLENGTYKGRNEARGDLLRISFNKGRIRRVKISGAARGTYFGEAKARAKSDSIPAAPKVLQTKPK
ncbi:MAG: hypothetical protein RL318_646, partial [Fibrobacterota bacterium]